MNTRNMQPTDDFLEIVDTVPTVPDEGSVRAWQVLVVDDDEDVHNATRMAISGVKILERRVTLLHARSGREGLEVAKANSGIAVALIDVVMERPDAGLKLVRDLRDAGFKELRIVLRTGQPGYAPELKIVSEYEIDDYKTKQELTRVRMLTTLTSAIRAYEQIQALSRSRQGLEMIVESATELFQRTNLELFSRGVLTQICGILGVEESGIVCVGGSGRSLGEDTLVVSAVGRFSDMIGRSVAEIEDRAVADALTRAVGVKEPVRTGGYMAIHFPTDGELSMWGLIETDTLLSESDLALLKLFATNISVGFENLSLVEKLDNLAYEDHLLQVPNLNAFMKALWERRRGLANPNRTRIAFVGLDRFSDLIATYGLDTSLALLKVFHDLLADSLGPGFLAARIGDGLFAVMGDRERLSTETIERILSAPIRVHGLAIPVSVTAALMDMSLVDGVPGAILRKAMAFYLYLNHHRPGQCVECGDDIRGAVERAQGIRRVLEDMSENTSGFEVYLQPKYDLRSGAMAGAEALLRWTWEGTAVPPSEFIPIAEAAGRTEILTEFVIRVVGRWAAERSGLSVRVAVNLSMADLNGMGFAARLLSVVDKAGLSPESLEFEVTEGVGMSTSPWALTNLEELHAKGYHISLDDFGTGYSSLGHFDRLPIDCVKIDRSFVKDLEPATADTSLSATILAMAQALDVGCVAEGIETEQQKQALLALGCLIGQGFLLGKPTLINDFDARYSSL